MQLHFAAGMNVVGRIEVVIERRYRLVERASGKRCFRLACARRRRSDAEKSEPRAFAVAAGGKPGHREITVTAREFAKAKAHIFCRRRNADSGEHVARSERGFVEVLEEIVGLHRARAFGTLDLPLAAERE